MGVAWIRHLVPFHRPASVATGVPVLSVRAPTAVHAETDVHDTASRKLPCAPEGLGMAWIRQVVPFQRSARDTMLPELFP